MTRALVLCLLVGVALGACGRDDSGTAATPAGAAQASQATTAPTAEGETQATDAPAADAQATDAPTADPQATAAPTASGAETEVPGALMATPAATLDAGPASQQAPAPVGQPGAEGGQGELLQLVPTLGPAEVGAVPPDLLARLTADAAARSGADQGGISVTLSEGVLWNDGALGCAQPGATYTQAPVEGYRVILRAGERDYDYRVGARGSFFVCEPGGAP